MPLTVSIAMCTYNGQPFLRQQLDSLAAQTHRPDEIVVRDDGSTDDTLKILHTFAAESGLNVRIIQNKENLGFSQNFERVMADCTGDVIFCCDQDDVWHADKIAVQLAPFEDEAVALTTAHSNVVDENLTPLGYTLADSNRFHAGYRRAAAAGHTFEVFLRHLGTAGHATALRRSLLPMLLPVPPSSRYDEWLILVGSTFGHAVLVDQAVAEYRKHERQVLGGGQKTLATLAASQATLKLDHLARQRETFVELLRRAEGAGVPAGKIRRLRGKVRFLQTRLGMRRSRLWRIGMIKWLLVSGAYHRYGRGWLTAARDLNDLRRGS